VIVPMPAEHAQIQDTRAPADTVEGNVAKTAGKVCRLVFVVFSMAGRPGGCCALDLHDVSLQARPGAVSAPNDAVTGGAAGRRLLRECRVVAVLDESITDRSWEKQP
jgi:hypothetical protein